MKWVSFLRGGGSILMNNDKSISLWIVALCHMPDPTYRKGISKAPVTVLK